tara:strand:- start:110 stop:313 length:204 start_codon:yes stop_codon:yes gene_type:complete
MTKEEKEITKAFIAMIKRNGWKPMKSEDGLAWFGGKTHYQLLDYLPKKAIDSHNHEDIDFLVVGWRT